MYIDVRVNTLNLIKSLGHVSKEVNRNRFLSLVVGSVLLLFFTVAMVVQFVYPEKRTICYVVSSVVIFITLVVIVIYFCTYGRRYVASVKKSKHHKYLVKMVCSFLVFIVDNLFCILCNHRKCVHCIIVWNIYCCSGYVNLYHWVIQVYEFNVLVHL